MNFTIFPTKTNEKSLSLVYLFFHLPISFFISQKSYVASFITHRPPEHFLDQSAAAKSEDGNTLVFKKYTSELGTNHFMLTGENDRFLYQGKSHASSRNSKYILGFCAGNSIKFIDVEQVFPMVQIVKKRARPEDAPAEAAAAKPEETYFEKRAQLIEDFGTKKSKKKIASMMTNIVEEKNIATTKEMQKILSHKAEEMEKTLHDSQEEMESLEMRNKRELLPPFDAATKDVEEVYKLYDVVPKEVLDSIDTSQDIEFFKKPKLLTKHKDLYQIYVLKRIVGLINESGIDSEEFRTKLPVLLYLNYLLKLHKMPSTISRSEEKIAETYGIPLPVTSHLLRTFTEISLGHHKDVKFTKNKRNADKLVCYILVLMLLCSGNFTLDVKEVQKALKIDHKKLVVYLKEIGCRDVVELTRKKKKTEEDEAAEEEKEDGDDKKKETSENEDVGDHMGSKTATVILKAPLKFAKLQYKSR